MPSTSMSETNTGGFESGRDRKTELAASELQCLDSHDVTFDLYIWKSPRDVDADQAGVLLKSWHEASGDPGKSPFEPSTDVGWFYRELMKDIPGVEASSDAVPNQSAAPIWLSTTPEPPARVVGVRLSPDTSYAELDAIFGLAAKYDLVVFDARSRRVHLPPTRWPPTPARRSGQPARYRLQSLAAPAA